MKKTKLSLKRDPKVEQKLYSLMQELFPICRSITGNGVRKTLKILKEEIDLKIINVPSGTKVFDWKIPNEWNIKDAYVKNSKGERIIDFHKSNLLSRITLNKLLGDYQALNFIGAFSNSE